MKTLESLLRGRLTNPRGLVGSLELYHNRVLLTFGAIGSLERVVCAVQNNGITVLQPDGLTPEATDEALQAARAEIERLTTALEATPEGTAALAEMGRTEAGGQDGSNSAAEGDNAGGGATEPGEGGGDAQRKAEGQSGGDGTEGEGGGDSGGEKTPEPVDPDDHLKPALIEMAKAAGVEVSKDDTKAEIAAKINTATGAVAGNAD